MRLVCVVLNYGTPDATISAVRSLGTPASQLDVIVVDNASPDESVRRIRADLPGAQIIVSRENDGFSAGCNRGIEEALRNQTGSVLVLNSDVRMMPEALATLDETLSSTVGIVGPLLIGPAPQGEIQSAGIRYSPIAGRMRHRLAGEARSSVTVPDVADVDAVSGAVMLVRREVFETIGGFTEDYFYGFEDLEFCLRAKAAGFRVVCAGSAIVEHEGAASIGRSSPRRSYFAARNHLLLASRVGPQAWPIRLARAANIVALNVAHACLRADGSPGANLAAVAKGVSDYLKGKYGPDR